MEVHEFIQKLEEIFDYKVKIKFAHTTKGNTWELTVKAKDEIEAVETIREIDSKMREFEAQQQIAKPKKEVKEHAEP